MTRQLTLADVFPVTIGGTPAVQIDRQIDRVAILGTLNVVEGAWRFKLVDLRTPPQRATGWFSLRDPRALQTHRRATSLRNQMGAEFGDQWRDILEWVIMTFQDNEADFEVEIQEPETEQEEPEPEPEPSEKLTEGEEEEIIRILGSTHALHHIKNHLDNLIAGEDENKLLIFLLLLSGKADDDRMKQMILLKGEAGAGKSTLMSIADLFNTKDVGRFTKRVVDHSKDLRAGNYEVLRLKELGKLDIEEEGMSTIKFLAADDQGYTVEETVRDPETNELTTITKKIPPITVISSTTRIMIDNQYERRNWIINPDESRDQTEKVKRWRSRYEKQCSQVELGLINETDLEKSKRILRHLVRHIEMCNCIIPFTEALLDILESSYIRVRGDYDKVITLVKLYGILQQNILPTVTDPQGIRKVFMTPEKAIEILQIAIIPLTTMSSSLGKERKMLELMEHYGYTEKGMKISKEGRDKMAQFGNISSNTARQYLNKLEETGYLSGEVKSSKTWTLLTPLRLIKSRLSAISEKIEKLSELSRLIEKMRKQASHFFVEEMELPGDPSYRGRELPRNYIEQLHHLRYLFATNRYKEEYPTPELQTLAKIETEAETDNTPQSPENTLQDEIEHLLNLGDSIMEDSDGHPVSAATVMTYLPEHYELDQMQVESLLRTLERDGFVYQPNPGRWKWEVY